MTNPISSDGERHIWSPRSHMRSLSWMRLDLGEAHEHILSNKQDITRRWGRGSVESDRSSEHPWISGSPGHVTERNGVTVLWESR